MKRILLVFLALAAFMTAGQALLGAFGPPQGGRFAERVHPVRQDAEAPETTLLFADGGETSLRAWRGQVAVVTMWATWCGICAREMPALQKLAERYRGRGLAVVTVSVDRAPAEALVLSYLESRGYDLLPPLIDAEGALAAVIGMRGTPTAVVVDKFGRIVAAIEGLGPWEDGATHEFLEGLIAAETPEDARALLTSS